MHQFLLQQDTDDQLKLFPHIVELGVVKNVSMRLNAFPKSTKESIRVYYILMENLNGPFKTNYINFIRVM
ncbi:MAG: hypothetical protein ABIP10_24485 [Ferruginibacter sp.]